MGKDADEMIGRQPKGSGKLAHVKVLLRMPLKGMTDGIDFFGIAGAEGSVRLHSVFEKERFRPERHGVFIACFLCACDAFK